MSDLNSFSEALQLASERRQKERDDFNTALGEPHKFIPDSDQDKRFGVGYWKADGGVVSYRRYANGYDPITRVQYTTEFIEMLTKVATSRFTEKQQAEGDRLMDNFVTANFDDQRTFEQVSTSHDELRDFMHSLGLCDKDAGLHLDLADTDKGDACHGLYVTGSQITGPIWRSE